MADRIHDVHCTTVYRMSFDFLFFDNPAVPSSSVPLTGREGKEINQWPEVYSLLLQSQTGQCLI